MSQHPDLALLKRTPVAESPVTSIPHPPTRWATRVLLPGMIALIFFLLTLSMVWQWLNPPLAVRVVPVLVRPLTQTAAAAFQAPGWLEADPCVNVVPALADGVVQEVLVLEGDAVQVGTVVARLVDEDARLSLRRQEEEVLRQSAEVAVSAANLWAAEMNWEHPVKLEQAVATGHHRLAETQASLTQLQAEVSAARGRENELAEQLRRQTNLARRDAVAEYTATRIELELETQQQVTAALSARKPVLEARLGQLTADLDAAQEDLRLRIVDRCLLDEARALQQRALAALAAAEAVRDEAALRLSRMSIRSNMDGVILRRLIRPGDVLAMSGEGRSRVETFHLFDPSKLQVRVDVPLADAARVHIGQSAEVIVDVLPEQIWTGRVTRIVPEADIQKNTLQVKIALDHPGAVLKPEMLSRVRFFPRAEAATGQMLAVFVPESLLRERTGDSARAFIVDPLQGIAREVTVNVGTRRFENWLEVTAGLQAGDRLISEPLTGIRPGVAVKVTGEGE